MEKKLPTIKEIAQRLNVSVSTVSRALHNHPSIGLRTKMQVQKLARELHYEPNQKAISLKQGKTFTMGVLLPNLQEQFFSIAVNGIEDVARKNNYNVLISQSHDDENREKQVIESFRRNRVDGILVSMSKNTGNYEHFLSLKDYNIPVVFFDRVPPVEETYSVSCSLKNSTVTMVDMLVQKGHKRIGFIRGPEQVSISRERMDGFREGLKKFDLKEEEQLIELTDLTTTSTEHAIGKMLSLQEPPTAIIAFNDYVALDAIRFAKKKGFQINKNLYFASYANLPITHYLDNPPFVSVEQFPYQQAEKATEMLLSILNRKSAEELSIPRHVVLEGKVVIHES